MQQNCLKWFDRNINAFTKMFDMKNFKNWSPQRHLENHSLLLLTNEIDLKGLLMQNFNIFVRNSANLDDSMS